MHRDVSVLRRVYRCCSVLPKREWLGSSHRSWRVVYNKWVDGWIGFLHPPLWTGGDDLGRCGCVVIALIIIALVCS